MFCANCGTENGNGEKYCKNCGAVLDPVSGQPGGSTPNTGYNGNTQYQYNGNQQYQYNGNQQPYYNNGNQFNENNVPAEYQPISMWGYFGYELLFSIPCIGLILLLVFSFGGTKNKNLQNFARSYFCLLIVIAVIVLIFGSAIAGSFAFMGNGSFI